MSDVEHVKFETKEEDTDLAADENGSEKASLTDGEGNQDEGIDEANPCELEKKEQDTRRGRQFSKEDIARICRNIEESFSDSWQRVKSLQADMVKEETKLEELRQEQQVLRRQLNEWVEH